MKKIEKIKGILFDIAMFLVMAYLAGMFERKENKTVVVVGMILWWVITIVHAVIEYRREKKAGESGMAELCVLWGTVALGIIVALLLATCLV